MTAFLCNILRGNTQYRLREPTRLGLIFSRTEHDAENIRFLPPLGKSHHSTIAFEFIVDG